MPPLPLASVVLRSLPWLSTRGRAAINCLILDNGRVPSARTLAARLGLRTRHQLARLLRNEGLPCYDVLTGWISLLHWRLEAERTNATLVALAEQSRMPAATSYRLVRRIAGAHWSDVRRTPTAEVLRRFLEQCGRARSDGGAREMVRRVPTERRVAGARGTVARRQDDRAASQRLALDGRPFAVATRSERELYIACPHAAAIERLDPLGARFIGTIPVGCVPTCITIDASHGRGYASLQYEDSIAVLDTREHSVVGMLRVPGDPFPVLLNRAGTRLYVSTNEDRLYAINLPSGRIAASLPLPATSHFLTLHPGEHRLYVATRAGGTVLEVDTARFCVSRTFVIGGEPLDLRVTSDGRFLMMANGRQGLNVVRLTDGKVVRTVRFGGRPVHVAMTADERTIYVSQVEAAAVAIVNCASWSARFVPTGGRPRGLALAQNECVLVVANEAGWVDLLPTAEIGR